MTTLKPLKRRPHVCMRCGSTHLNVEHRSDIVEFKALTLEVDRLAETVCSKCDLRWTTEAQERENLAVLKAAFVAKRDAVRLRDGLLTGAEIDRTLRALGLARPEAARLFGGGPDAFGKYIRGEALQSAAIDRLLRLTLAIGPQAIRCLRLVRNAPLRLV